MADGPYIFEVGSADFHDQVLAKSMDVPVLVDFWAAWCGPCQSLEPVLERVADTFSGSLLIAKVDTDAEPELAARYGIRSLPTLVLFAGGEPRAQSLGAQPEGAIRKLVRPYVKTPADVLAERGAQAARDGDLGEARRLLEKAVAAEPDRPGPRFGLAELLLAAGDPAGAEDAIEPLSAADKESELAHVLRDRIRFTREIEDAPPAEALRRKIEDDATDLESRYLLAARLVLQGELGEALDHFLEIMGQDREFREDGGRRGLLAVFNILGADSELAATYRKRMAALLH